MTNIFLSHSSKDKAFVRKLADDLADMGHAPWLDEREIRVGESIVSRVGEAVSLADYVVIVLSNNSVASGWFEKEWESKLWQEINQRKTMVIPVLIEDCAIPILLQTKKYADFRKNYTKGFVELMSGISPILAGDSSGPSGIPVSKFESDIATILSKVQSRELPLAACLTDGLALAHKMNDDSLGNFCRQEISGWDLSGVHPQGSIPPYRVVEMFISVSEINMQSWAWSGLQSIFSYMRDNPQEFVPYKSFIQQSVSQLESQDVPDPSKAMIHLRTTMGKVNKGVDRSFQDHPVWIYGRSDSYRNVLEAIRQRFTELLLERLPKLDPP